MTLGWSYPVNQLGRLELMRESLVAVVGEMRANIIHSSYSSIIYEGHDFSCALLTADGQLLAQGDADNPIHIFSVPYSTAEVLREFSNDINEGDIFLHNDPYTGGTHLNDILMLYPVFHNGQLAMFAAARCHWGDVGGMTPGSLSGRVNEVYQEGIRIPPTRICNRGKMNKAFLELMFSNMRITHERRGDFNTMLGASRKAAEHLQRLFKRFGGEDMLDAITELIARSEEVMRNRIKEVSDGTYFAEGYLDSDGHGPEPLIGRLKLTIHNESMTADFSGSHPQTAGPTNVGPAMAFNAVATIVKSYLDPDTPVNHGSFNPLTIINPPGSFLNAVLPAPCGGMAECRALMCGLMVSALGQALPDMLVGDLKGGANHMYISGIRSGNGELYMLYEYPAAGTGATGRTDGGHAVRAFSEGDFNTVQATEIVEAQCPIRVVRYELREGSCGDGEFRGGCGLRRELELLEDGSALSVLGDKNIIPPFGVAAGASGAANRFTVERNGQLIEPSPIPGKVGAFPLLKGDIVRVETSGGGGFGDPTKRDPYSVKQDIALEYISSAQAESRYGIVLNQEGDLDQEASATKRKAICNARVKAVARLSHSSREHSNQREILLSRKLANRLKIEEGDLIELTTPKCGASLRGWTIVNNKHTDLQLGPSAMAILGAHPGDEIEIRSVPRVPN